MRKQKKNPAPKGGEDTNSPMLDGLVPLLGVILVVMVVIASLVLFSPSNAEASEMATETTVTEIATDIAAPVTVVPPLEPAPITEEVTDLDKQSECKLSVPEDSEWSFAKASAIAKKWGCEVSTYASGLGDDD
jgi:hypothetical protein